MKASFMASADRDLESMDAGLRKFFIKHVDKLLAIPPRRHLKFGIPYQVEDVTRQARLVFDLKDEELFVIRCFATHKEYEKWYKSFK